MKRTHPTLPAELVTAAQAPKVYTDNGTGSIFDVQHESNIPVQKDGLMHHLDTDQLYKEWQISGRIASKRFSDHVLDTDIEIDMLVAAYTSSSHHASDTLRLDFCDAVSDAMSECLGRTDSDDLPWASFDAFLSGSSSFRYRKMMLLLAFYSILRYMDFGEEPREYRSGECASTN